MLYKNIKLEERNEKEPKFNIHNKTDRKILFTVIGISLVLIALIVGLVIVYYQFFYGGEGNGEISSQVSSLIKILKK